MIGTPTQEYCHDARQRRHASESTRHWWTWTGRNGNLEESLRAAPQRLLRERPSGQRAAGLSTLSSLSHGTQRDRGKGSCRHRSERIVVQARLLLYDDIHAPAIGEVKLTTLRRTMVFRAPTGAPHPAACPWPSTVQVGLEAGRGSAGRLLRRGARKEPPVWVALRQRACCSYSLSSC